MVGKIKKYCIKLLNFYNSRLFKEKKPLNAYKNVTFLKPIEVEVVEQSYSNVSIIFPNFSVVIPVKNEEKLLDCFFSDLLRQTLLPSEIIFVDHASEDGTLQKLQKFSVAHPELNVKILKSVDSSQQKLTRRSTLSGNRNYGVLESSSEYVVFVDVGNRLPNTLFAALVGPFAQDDTVDLVGGIYKTQSQFLDSILTFDWKSVNWSTFLPGARAVAFKRSLYLKCGGQAEFLTYAGEDLLFDINYRRLSTKWVFNKCAQVTWLAPETKKDIFNKFFAYGSGGAENGEGASHFQIFSDKVNSLCLLSDFGKINLLISSLFLGYLKAQVNIGKVDNLAGIKKYVFIFCDKHPVDCESSRNMIVENCKNDTQTICIFNRYPVNADEVYFPVDPSKFMLLNSYFANTSNLLTRIQENRKQASIALFIDLNNASDETKIIYNRYYKYFRFCGFL